jgi:hypothetical protein
MMKDKTENKDDSYLDDLGMGPAEVSAKLFLLGVMAVFTITILIIVSQYIVSNDPYNESMQSFTESNNVSDIKDDPCDGSACNQYKQVLADSTNNHNAKDSYKVSFVKNGKTMKGTVVRRTGTFPKLAIDKE